MKTKMIFTVLSLFIGTSVWACLDFSGRYESQESEYNGKLVIHQKNCETITGAWESGNNGFERTLNGQIFKIPVDFHLVKLIKWEWSEEALLGEEVTQDILTNRDLFTYMYKWTLDPNKNILEEIQIYNFQGKLISKDSVIYSPKN